ncbi:hypothetical protein ABPG77_005407 [Micractinium sp. CCAP 211/92]
MAGPEMQPLLGRPKGGKNKPSVVGLAEAVLLIVVLLIGYWHGVHALQHAVHVHHSLTMLFPLFGAAGLALLLPPILYLGLASEFGGLHPLWPPHYVFLSRRLLRALQNSGQLKVSAKEI